jgi:CheY-like chemotaxis protein
MSGSPQVDPAAELASAKHLGADAILLKPFTRQQLIQAMQFPPEGGRPGKGG